MVFENCGSFASPSGDRVGKRAGGWLEGGVLGRAEGPGPCVVRSFAACEMKFGFAKQIQETGGGRVVGGGLLGRAEVRGPW